MEMRTEQELKEEIEFVEKLIVQPNIGPYRSYLDGVLETLKWTLNEKKTTTDEHKDTSPANAMYNKFADMIM